MKRCRRCGQTKPYSEFYRRSDGAGDGYQYYCRPCKNASNRERYTNDPHALEVLQRSRNKDKRAKLEWFRALKESSPCTDCGQYYPYYVMQFDHIGDDKQCKVATLASSGAPMSAVMAEIVKCELVCANCHAVRTHRRHEERRSTL